jgi:hypothetical protein
VFFFLRRIRRQKQSDSNSSTERWAVNIFIR